ncbi:hypothetical protein EJ05DRAFT_144833 [Pseudovirgaria hyperparasitica]|uniref:Uncharacterized protein n=1 Tax=Pseudovirgaria hyperparasitica TaxID=470096 RepID=A0A6A6VY24_9PEZI|nr:uncharacterized protein EJ05DRAFT_144833 [Pseudovirgaria hyperparasitica]KAF2754550.1 hypothetical protein EJ05DRAFT_144833 [Pseudovirgaria hyperparasitica]
MTAIRAPCPIVLEHAKLLPLLIWISNHRNTKVTILICETRSDFETRIILELLATGSNILHPTLERLSNSRYIDLRFCSTAEALHAYLTAYSVKSTASIDEDTEASVLAIVDPIKMHEMSPLYSAQGLSKFFAAAVDASTISGAQLYVVECAVPLLRSTSIDIPMDDYNDTPAEATSPGLDLEEVSIATEIDPWNAEVPILNATTRTFGPGQRGWMGRTVGIKRIAARWCIFKRLDET